MRLNVGCGTRLKEGYLHCDIRNLPHIDFVCPGWKIPVEDNAFEEVYSRQFLEHCSFIDAKKCLKEWKRILEPRGLVHIEVPDLLYHARQLSMPGNSTFTNHVCSNRTHALHSIYGWQNNETDFHRSGWCLNTLENLLSSLGYQNIIRLPSRECDLVMGAKK